MGKASVRYKIERVLNGGERIYSKREFATYEEAERFVMALVDYDVKYYEGKYLPTYKINERKQK